MAEQAITGNLAQLWVAPVADTDTLVNAAAYAALTWTQVKRISSIGALGPTSNLVTATDLDESLVVSAKGVRDNGNLDCTCIVKRSDAGQSALITAEGTNVNFAFKRVPRDRLNATGTDSIAYCFGLVNGAQESELTSDGVFMITFNIKINSNIIRVAATAGS